MSLFQSLQPEEDSLAGQEDAAIGRDLVALAPDPCVDLGLKVELKPKLIVLGMVLEAGAEKARERQPVAARNFRERVSRCG